MWDATEDERKSFSCTSAAQIKGQRVVHGRGLWRFISRVVSLEKNYRQQDDPEYQHLLERLAHGVCVEKDFSMLCSRLRSNVDDVQRFRDLDNL